MIISSGGDQLRIGKKLTVGGETQIGTNLAIPGNYRAVTTFEELWKGSCD